MSDIYYYELKIYTVSPSAVAGVLEKKSESSDGVWSYSVRGNSGGQPDNCVIELLSILGGRFALLEKIGVSQSDITVLLNYEYEDQCNLEIMPEVMSKLSSLNISLCISCWKKMTI